MLVEKLFRVCEYLKETADMVLRFGKNANPTPMLEGYIDASFGNHLDGNSNLMLVWLLITVAILYSGIP